jgi:hypothetical protein
VTVADLRKAQAAVAAGRWRESASEGLGGLPIAKAMGLHAMTKAHRTKISAMLKIWTANGMFVVVDGLDAKREKRNFVEVGEPAND